MSHQVIYVFDMDGTLTPARLPMTEDFAARFRPFIATNKVYIASGSDVKKIYEQMPKDMCENVSGLYCSMGNELYIHGEEIYHHDFTPEASLLERLENYRKNTLYPYTLYPNYIEKRIGMLNFSILGRDCPHDERYRYKLWDDEHQERRKIADELIPLYPQYDISLGGNISMDIVPKGFGKDQIGDHLRAQYPDNKIVFIGDRTEKGGNDYELARRLTELGNSEVINVDGPDDVISILNL
ncbi:MAG: HAD-IIB family hydrolase [Alphaproteobacteria bacterium]|nr:HAD-IIB family hydrolase [Alphaproteobacteria bacterium]